MFDTDDQLLDIAKCARTDPDARLRMLVAIYDMANLSAAVADALIADELLIGEECTDNTALTVGEA